MKVPRCREWPVGYTDGMAVTYQGRSARVVAVPKSVVPGGHVPIMYDDESGCFVTVPADDLSRIK